jgi:hypothetical protein
MSLPLQQTPAAPPSPAAPAAAAPAKAPAAKVVVYTGSLPGGAMTKEDVANLRARRSELSDQIESATGRRRELAEQVRRADGVNKAGLETRLATLDQRIVRLEGELDEVGQQLASPQAATYVAQTRPPMNFEPPRFSNVDPEPIIICFILFVLSPLALSISRLIWKRGTRVSTRTPALHADAGERLERIEQGMDAIAIEVERVSEGQRFVTKLLSERNGLGLNAAQQPAEPVRVPVGEAARVR